ncbi:hypothetical protein ANRL1_03098 [Anaerolineae bacterium]|nr:hypothetical protein ANRL1_03098 [Anaerolineae bacterium]
MSASSDNIRDMLVRGIAAAKTKSKEEARFYFEWITRSEDASHDDLREAWLWLSRLADDPKQQRECLEQALAYDPTDPEARRELKLLNGELKAADIVDPDHLAPRDPATATPVQARRFVCPHCAGRMAFAPDGNSLTCEYCGKRQSLADVDVALVAEQDFLIALATAKGHTQPTMQRAFTCASCGASFVLAPAALALKCPYCETAYAIEKPETRELIEPAGVVPFAITLDQALRTELKWFRDAGFELRGNPVPPVGVYLPVWTFDLGGEIEWNCMVQEYEMQMPSMRAKAVWRRQTGSKVVYENDVCVFASHTLNVTLLDELRQFPLEKLAPYDSGYLADFPAETYQVTVSDASLVARSRVSAKTRAEIEADISGTYVDLTVSTTRLVIESYKLILVPMWIAHYKLKGKQHTIVINGCTGALRAEKPQGGITKWLADLLGS